MGRKHNRPGLMYDEQLPIRKTGFHNLRIEQTKFKTEKQKLAAEIINDNFITFLIGSAGTGKSFLLMRQALQELKDGKINKIVLTRPTIEAGDTLGFLPGDLDEKIGPYLRPLVTIAEELIGKEAVDMLVAEKVIEFIPLQFMRGVTFNNTFIIIDEAQNADVIQFKLALTRIGENTKCGISADPKQLDLEPEFSCIKDFKYFKNVDGIGFVEFSDSDVMRSKAVKLVLECYNKKLKDKGQK